MPEYSEQDLEYAAEFREGIHKEALAIVRKTCPNAAEVVDRRPLEDYFRENWDYPGKWYTVVSIPYGCRSRRDLIDTIVRDTLSGKAPEEEPANTRELRDVPDLKPDRRRLTSRLDTKPEGYEERFVVENDRKNRCFRAVGLDSEGRYILERSEERGPGSPAGHESAYYVLTDPEYGRYARLALLNGQITEGEYNRLTTEPGKAPKQDVDPFDLLIAEYPDLVVEYCIVKDERYCGYESHRKALKTAYARLCSGWNGDPGQAAGKSIAAAEMFSSEYPPGRLNYRKAFLYPPHDHGYTGMDFVRVNAALFPNGTDGLEVYEWNTDWSDYFDDGHEWWGTLCLTVYDKTLGRFTVIMASATD